MCEDMRYLLMTILRIAELEKVLASLHSEKLEAELKILRGYKIDFDRALGY